MSQEKSKTMPMQIFWGVKEVYHGIVQVENMRILCFELVLSFFFQFLSMSTQCLLMIIILGFTYV